jgi:hypothetical protein
MDILKEIDREIDRLKREKRQILKARKSTKKKHPDLFLKGKKKVKWVKVGNGKQGLLGL